MDTSVFWIAACVLYATFLAFVLWHRARAGPVILDLGGRNRALWLACNAIISMAAAAAVVEWFGHRAKPIWPAVLSSETAILFLIVPSWRLQIRENGIFRDGHLFPWSRLKSYRWGIPMNTVFHRSSKRASVAPEIQFSRGR